MANVDDLLAALGRLPPVCPCSRLNAGLLALITTGEREGLIERWTVPPDIPSVVLTPLGCDRLGVKLDPLSKRWVPAGTRFAPEIALPSGATRETDLGIPSGLGGLPDNGPGPPVLLDQAERCERQAKVMKPVESAGPLSGPWRFHDESSGRVPRPVRVIGIRWIWTGPLRAEDPCPVCSGHRLHAAVYCLLCDRSGLDHLLPPVLPRQLPKSPASMPVPCPDDPGYVVRNGVKVPERFLRKMMG